MPRYVAFADWMRRHVAGHRYRHDVIPQSSWSEMCWDRLSGEEGDTQLPLPWSSRVIDTSGRSPAEASSLVARGIREQIATDND